MQRFKYTGNIHAIQPTQTFSSGFSKRMVIVKENDPEAKFPHYAAFEFIKDNTTIPDRFKVGDLVEISFNLDANESKTKAGSWFPSAKAWKMERLGAVNAPTALPMAQEYSSSAEDDGGVDDMPF